MSLSHPRGSLSQELGLGDWKSIGATNCVRQREDLHEHDAIHRVHVVDVDLFGVSLEGSVDVLVHERDDVGLLHGDHVVAVEGLRGIGTAELLVQGQELVRRDELFFRHLVEVRTVRSIEGEPDGEGQEVTKRERRFIQGTPERFCNVCSERRLRALEALERIVELGARLFIIICQTFPHAFEGMRRDTSIRRDRANGRTTNPHGFKHLARPIVRRAGFLIPEEELMDAPVAVVPKSRTGERATRFVEFLRKSWGKLAFTLSIVTPLVCFTVDEFSARVPHGVRSLDTDLSRLTIARAEAAIRESGRHRLSRPLSLEIEGRTATLLPEKSGISVDATKTVERALAVGRDRALPQRFLAWIERFFETTEVLPVLSRMDAQLFAALDRAGRETLELPRAGGLRLEGERFVAELPRAGRKLERADAARAVLGAVERGESRIRLRSVAAEAPLSAHTVEALAQRANHWARSGVVLAEPMGSRSLELEPRDLRGLFDPLITPPSAVIAIDPARLERWLTPRRGELESSPVSARFVIDAQDRVEIVPSERAKRIAVRALAKAILRAAAGEERVGELPFEPGEEAALTTQAAEELGIRGLVSTFTTRHACCEGRVENIHRIADLLDGLIVRPGETVSVNALVGPRTEENGFVPAPAIEAGELVDTVGGGISQFATTLFNALFYGGYDIVERQAHTYWFARYPKGHEATLSYPKPDLVFRNDTESGMLFDTVYDKTSITVRIFGDNGGRSVRAEVSEKKDLVEPAVELMGNPKVSPAKERVKEPGMAGWSVLVGRILTYPDGTVKEERRKVTYRPRTRRVEVHPCRVPKGEKGYTGEPCPEPPERVSEDNPYK